MPSAQPVLSRSMWFQKTIALQPQKRGFHLITRELLSQLPELANIQVGIAHIFIQHTSAALCINENADPTVRVDMESYFNRAVPENEPYFLHNYEGSDDMPAHIKAVTLGSSVTVPVNNGRFHSALLGIYQVDWLIPS